MLGMNQNDTLNLLEKIKKLSLAEQKNLLARMVKLQEESGELAQEVLIHEKCSGSAYKEAGPDGIMGEAVDVLLVALSIFFKVGGSVEDLGNIMDKKSSKWQKFQAKS